MSNAWCSCCDSLITDYDESISCDQCGRAVCETCMCNGRTAPLEGAKYEVCEKCLDSMCEFLMQRIDQANDKTNEKESI